MKLKYFDDTDTLFIEFNNKLVNETKELDQNTYADYDSFGNLVSITLEHAKQTTKIKDFQYEVIEAV